MKLDLYRDSQSGLDDCQCNGVKKLAYLVKVFLLFINWYVMLISGVELLIYTIHILTGTGSFLISHFNITLFWQ